MGFIFIYPKEMIYSVKGGLLLWYNSVLPSVFPFLIASNILISIGAVSKLGRIATPVMKPVFNVSGRGAFALIMGGISGYPVGAKIISDLRETGKITKDEAQRLISFCNNGGPVFITGAVGAAMLGSSGAGYFILFTNGISILLVGLLFRFYSSNGKYGKTLTSITANRERKTLERLSFGKVMALSVTKSIETILQIGGFILIFGALITALELSGTIEAASNLLEPVFSVMGLDTSLCPAFVSGVLEITNGVKMIGETAACFKQKVVLSGMLVSFGGFSIYAQTAGFISKTDISAGIYLVSKLLQSAIQAAASILLYDLFF